MSDRDHLTLEEFSRRCGLSVVTLRRYVKKGRLSHVQPGGPGHRVLIPADALEELRVAGRTSAAPAPAGPERPPPEKTLSGPKPSWQAGPRPQNP